MAAHGGEHAVDHLCSLRYAGLDAFLTCRCHGECSESVGLDRRSRSERSILTRSDASSTLSPAAVDVEGVDDLVAHRHDPGGADVEAEVGERARAIRKSRPIASGARTSTIVVGAGTEVVDDHPRLGLPRPRWGGGADASAAMLLEPLLDRQLAPQSELHVGGHRAPVGAVAVAVPRLELELRDRGTARQRASRRGRTSWPWSASTPTTRLNTPGSSGATTVTSPAPSTSTPPATRSTSASSPRSGPARLRVGAGEHGARRVRRARDEAGLPVAPRAGPVASESASVSAASRCEQLDVPTGVGDRGDRGGVVEVAAGGDRGQEQVVAHHARRALDVGRLEAHPRGDSVGERSTPSSVWSPGQPLPMSWSSAPTRSRSGRPTSRVSAAARAAASTRWRSTVKRWKALRCGLLRTGAHSGRMRVTQAVRGRGSRRPGSPRRPPPSRRDERVARLVGPRVGSAGASAAAAQGRAARSAAPWFAARRPPHEQQPGRRRGRRRPSSAISPSRTTIPRRARRAGARRPPPRAAR